MVCGLGVMRHAPDGPGQCIGGGNTRLRDGTDAHRHGLVFTTADIDRLIATALTEKRHWDALAPFSPDIQWKFEASHKPDGWGGLSTTPWYLMLQTQLR